VTVTLARSAWCSFIGYFIILNLSLAGFTPRGNTSSWLSLFFIFYVLFFIFFSFNRFRLNG
jgi:hypothetical protein